MSCLTSIPKISPPREKSWFIDRARVLAALSNPARLRMVVSLADGEKCVCDLAAEVGLDMSTTSRHLVQLRQAGILADERRGNMVFYSLRATCLPSFLECLDGLSGKG